MDPELPVAAQLAEVGVLESVEPEVRLVEVELGLAVPAAVLQQERVLLMLPQATRSSSLIVRLFVPLMWSIPLMWSLSFMLNVSVPTECRMSDSHLCAILGNLIDNSINASSMLVGSKSGECSLKDRQSDTLNFFKDMRCGQCHP